MSEYIVIRREELANQLTVAFKTGHDVAACRYAVIDLEGDYKKFADSLPAGWLPISNAPKDGRWVLVAKSNGSAWIVSCCFWRIGFWEDANGHEFNIGINEPTHFLPLIEPEII